MAEEYCGVNWWELSSTNRTRFDGGGGGGGGGSSTSSTATLANSGGGGGYVWLTEGSTAVDINAAAAASSFQETKMDASTSQLVGLGLSSHAMADWNQQPILRNPERAENSFRSMLQDGMGLNTNFPQESSTPGVMFDNNNNNSNNSSQLQWKEKLFPISNEDCSTTTDYKQQIGRGFSLDNQPPQFSPSGSSIESSVTNQGLATSFQIDSSSSTTSVYGGSPSSSILQGLMGSDQQNHQPLNLQPNYFGMAGTNDHHHYHKQQQPQQPQQLHFINNAPYWNASSVPPVNVANNIRPNNFFNMQTFAEKPKTTSMEVRDTNSVVKKSGTENTTKRARNDGASSTLPPFKVRKEKMGDRITALQQLVSPFGKTDTASVLSEAIEYIKFLHEQVSVLSNPYLKSGGASYQQHQPSNDKAKIDPDGPKQDLKSRGLCLVPVSSTFPVTHETTVDFWTPSFGGTFR